jgi:hypothetical protein
LNTCVQEQKMEAKLETAEEAINQELTRVTVPAKDPKKQAAGRRGAAARIAKQEQLKAEQEQLKAELQAAKTALLTSKSHEDELPAPKRALPEPAVDSRAVVTNSRHNTDWTPWVVGGICIGGIVLYTCRKESPQRIAATLSRSDKQQLPVTESQPNVVLKTVNPFYME